MKPKTEPSKSEGIKGVKPASSVHTYDEMISDDESPKDSEIVEKMLEEDRIVEEVLNEVLNEFEDRMEGLWNCPEDHRKYLERTDLIEAIKLAVAEARKESLEECKNCKYMTDEIADDIINRNRLMNEKTKENIRKEARKDCEKERMIEIGGVLVNTKAIRADERN